MRQCDCLTLCPVPPIMLAIGWPQHRSADPTPHQMARSLSLHSSPTKQDRGTILAVGKENLTMSRISPVIRHTSVPSSVVRCRGLIPLAAIVTLLSAPQIARAQN